MVSKADSALRLLIIEDTAEDAEYLVSVLRNAGIAVRPQRAEDEEDLDQHLAESPLDLILATSTSKALKPGQICDHVQRSGKDLPIIAIAVNPSVEQISGLIKSGMRDVAHRSSPDHIQLIVKREWEALRNRRTLRRVEVSLRESEKRANSLLASSRDPICYVHEGMHVYANPAYLDMFGFEDFDEIEGMSILDMIAPEAAENFKQLLKSMARGERPPDRLEIKARKPLDGSSFNATMEFSEASIEGEPCTQIVFRQRTGDPNVARQLEEMKIRDLVTGLLNRTAFLESLERAVNEALAGKSEQMLLYVEIDGYRGVLDKIGVGFADLLLGDAAQILRDQVGEGEIAARCADHAFGLLCPARGLKEAEALGKTLCKAFADRLFEVNGQGVHVNVSVGVTPISEKSGSAEQVLNMAATACRAAQQAGGNGVHIHDPRAQERELAEQHSHWIHLVKEALAKDQFVLFYQPIVSLHGDDSECYEILLRMQGPKGEITPNFFMPAAESAGLMTQIDRWVIGRSIDVLAERSKGGTRSRFFVKLTSQSLEDSTMLAWLAGRLKAARISGDSLVLEMPESKVTTNIKAARAFLDGLQQLKVGFALEQFGSGLNSFQLLRHLPVSYLKIDRSFMVDLPKSSENQGKVKEITDQAHATGKLTIAEFVEDALSMSILFQCGVNYVQGNFLQEPEKVLAYEFSGN